MKALIAIAGLLLVFAFLAGCTQQGNEPTPTPTPAGTGTTLSEAEQEQAISEFNSGLVDPSKEIDLGEMA
ncbi:MAG: hypothetical protein QXK06_04655 [Candidatus Diapherotrites archaeon]